ncbi:hypothetical protein chiPu_0009764 [Chiloscyllium punctatum]|uniref:Uncharacterized protein n=1 Tax=Chiloscyllium punctatum TaxID=137246 RepID=A0A401SLN3_CHIPU|nr:hypothetical protein [Chiloscyllium punctatum]
MISKRRAESTESVRPGWQLNAEPSERQFSSWGYVFNLSIQTEGSGMISSNVCFWSGKRTLILPFLGRIFSPNICIDYCKTD